jgi:5'-nucleotidase
MPGAAAFVAAILVALLGLYADADTPPRAESGEARGVVKLRLLGVNDLHGHLEPPRPGIGGAAWLKAHLDRATLPGRTIRVHAGDMIGASPLISSWFHDEPAMEAGNELGFDVGTLGNHEFDEGGDELDRILRGGQRTGPEALERDAEGNLVNTSSPDYAGASYPYVAANTIDREGRLRLPPYMVVERAGVRVGFIGVTTPSTPNFLLDRHAERFRFTDISDAVNRWVGELRGHGVRTIVVLAHAGGPAQDESDAPDFVGEIVEEAREMSSEVDAVIAGHSHSQLDIRVPNVDGSGDKLIVEALSYGIAYDLVDLTIDRRTGDVVAKTGRVPATSHDIAEDAEVAALVEGYRGRVAPLATRVLGSTESGLTRAGGELGRLVADAERAFARTDAAVVSRGALRADIGAGPITYAELAAALAYDHPVVRLRLTGRRLRALAAGAGFYSGPAEPDPDRAYSVAASEMLMPHGRPVGSEVEAVAWYLER